MYVNKIKQITLTNGSEVKLYSWSSVFLVWILPKKKILSYLYVVK